MANAFSQGVIAGEEQKKSNPFNLIMNRYLEASARRYKEDQERKKEEAELYRALQVLNKDFLYKQELAKTEGEQKLTQQQKLLETFGLTPSKEVTTEGEKVGGLKDITSRIPEGVTLDLGGGLTITGKKTAEEKGIEESTKESFTRAEGIKRAAKKLASITQQFNEALPQKQTSDFTLPFRISGSVAGLGARFGLKANPQLTALQDTSKLQLRSILRDMGEGARMSDQDIQQNLAVIEQAGLSDKERIAKVRSFMQTAIDAMDTEVMKIITKDESSMKLLQDFGVRMNKGQQTQQQTGKIPSFNSEQEAEASGIKGEVIINGRRARID